MPGQSAFLNIDEEDALRSGVSQFGNQPGYTAPHPLNSSVLPAPGDKLPQNVGGIYGGAGCAQPACGQQTSCDTGGASVGFHFHFNPASYCPCVKAWKPCALLAEFLGTMILVFAISAVAACTCGVDDINGWLLAKIVVGLVAGWVLFALVAVWGPISGGHFNPHVTCALFFCGKINAVAACLYILVQFIGSVVAGALLLIFYDSYHCCLGTPQLGSGISSGTGLAAEIIGTTILVLVILFAIEYNPSTAPLAIGLTLGLLQFVFLTVSGASFNFFRYIGPAIFSGCFDDWWVWLVGPIVGACIGWALYKACLALRCWGNGTGGSYHLFRSGY